jgi:hypothetical protein
MELIMSTKTLEVPIFNAEMNEITQCQLTKRDLLELVEAETEKEINARMDVLRGQTEELSTKIDKCIDQIRPIDIKEEDRIRDICITLAKKAAITVDTTCTDPHISTGIINISYVYNDKDKNHDYGYNREVIGVSVGRVSVIINIKTDNTDARISTHFIVPLTESYKSKVISLYNARREIALEKHVLDEEYRNLAVRLRDIKTEIKQISAGITRKALESDEKGKSVLSLLTQMRNSARKQIAEV